MSLPLYTTENGEIRKVTIISGGLPYSLSVGDIINISSMTDPNYIIMKRCRMSMIVKMAGGRGYLRLEVVCISFGYKRYYKRSIKYKSIPVLQTSIVTKPQERARLLEGLLLAKN